jgi:hypothetical protein
MPHFMLNREISVPDGYQKRGCLLVSYRLPLLKHCFVLCSERCHEMNAGDKAELMTFFLGEAERLALSCVGDSEAFMLIHSGRSARKRPSWHLHVIVVQHRWQKAWVYMILGAKNLALVCYKPLCGWFKATMTPNPRS